MSAGHPACEGRILGGPGSGEPCLSQALRQTREDLETSRHLAIRNDRTRRGVEGQVPCRRRACRKDGPGRCARRRITALFETQLIRDSALCHECCGHGLCTRQPTCIWRLLGKATSKARDAADYSRVVRVGTGDTAKRCDQSCISIMADLDHQCARAITEGKGQR